jgi:Protein of unknown function (DUF736)
MSLCVNDGGSHGGLHQFVLRTRPTQPRMDGSGPEGRLRLDRLPTTARPAFFPCRQAAAFLAGQKKPSAAVLRDASGLTAAGRSLPGPRTAIEAAIGAARQQRKTTMATIGTFTAADNGYGGSVKTLTLNFRAKFVPTETDNDD